MLVMSLILTLVQPNLIANNSVVITETLNGKQIVNLLIVALVIILSLTRLTQLDSEEWEIIQPAIIFFAVAIPLSLILQELVNVLVIVASYLPLPIFIQKLLEFPIVVSFLNAFKYLLILVSTLILFSIGKDKSIEIKKGRK